MGNYSCACDFCHTNYKSEQNLSREYISTEKNLNRDSNISIFFQKKYMININSKSSNIFPSTTKIKNLNKNISPSSKLNQLKSSNKEIKKDEIGQIKKINENYEMLQIKDDNKINDKMKMKSNIKTENIKIEKKNLYNDIFFKNKRKYREFKNIGISQSTKVLNESELNSVLLKSTVYEYK